ncbi:unnamed protein product [Peniophora sp. CBMAI 1063]|nr:unnamed protein product [Peniophora sp. CBMAI 1063]
MALPPLLAAMTTQAARTLAMIKANSHSSKLALASKSDVLGCVLLLLSAITLFAAIMSQLHELDVARRAQKDFSLSPFDRASFSGSSSKRIGDMQMVLCAQSYQVTSQTAFTSAESAFSARKTKLDAIQGLIDMVQRFKTAEGLKIKKIRVGVAAYERRTQAAVTSVWQSLEHNSKLEGHLRSGLVAHYPWALSQYESSYQHLVDLREDLVSLGDAIESLEEEHAQLVSQLSEDIRAFNHSTSLENPL